MSRRILQNKRPINPTKKQIAQEIARERSVLDGMKRDEKSQAERLRKLNADAKKIIEENTIAGEELSETKEQVKESKEIISLLKGEEDVREKKLKQLDKDTANKIKEAHDDLEEINSLLNSKKESFNKEMISMNSDIDSIKDDKEALLNSKDELSKDISNRNSELKELADQLSSASKKLDNTRNALESDKKQLIESKARLKIALERTETTKADRILIEKEITSMDELIITKGDELDKLDGDKVKIENDKLALLKRDIKLNNLAGKVKRYYSKAGIKLDI